MEPIFTSRAVREEGHEKPVNSHCSVREGFLVGIISYHDHTRKRKEQGLSQQDQTCGHLDSRNIFTCEKK